MNIATCFHHFKHCEYFIFSRVSFKNQVLNCVNTLICHRLNDQDSADAVANWIGTKDVFTLTAQLNMKASDKAKYIVLSFIPGEFDV